MLISRVNLIAYNRVGIAKNSSGISVGYCRNPICPTISNKNSYSDTVSFGIKTPVTNHKEFRMLTKDHVIHCIYCKKPLIYHGTLRDMLARGVFSGPVSEFVKEISPYRGYMKRGQQQVFDQIAKYAEKSPQTHLEEILQLLHQNSIKRLVKTQARIFKLLIEESKKLPPDMQKRFRQFMKVQHKRLYEIPYQEKFNPETFAYKVHKMVQSVPNPELRGYLLRITAPMTTEKFKNPENLIPRELGLQMTSSRIDKLHTAKDFSEYVIYRVQKIGERLDRQDIVRLCRTSQRMIEGKKVIIPFSNKEFLKELAKVELAELRPNPVYYDMLAISRKLPSSNSNMSSFVVKHRYSNSDTIGYQLLKPSITTIEHEKTRTSGGSDALSNCVLACNADNFNRGSMPQYVYLDRWNKKNPQVYFDDVIKISNEENLISPSDIEGQALTLKEQGHVEVDLSALKGGEK